jgi:hypothetical protein
MGMSNTRNWKEYNSQLVRRGEFYISLDFVDQWDSEIAQMNMGKRGRPFKFPERLMEFLAFLHVAFLPYRQMEGFLRKLSGYIPKLQAADYTTICKRLHCIQLDISMQDIPNDVIIAVDATGMKVSSRGEWMRHKWKVHKGWIKVHIAVDVQTKKLLAVSVTDERTGEGQLLPSLVEQAQRHTRGKVTKALGDGAYDSKANFNYLSMRHIQPGIKTRRNASTQARGSPARAAVVRERHQFGYDGWRGKYRYGQRWMAESYFSGVKRMFGETVRAHTQRALFQEVMMKFIFYDALITR